MPEEVTSIFDNLHDPFARPRKKMLPWWIKFFAWVFLVFGLIIPIILIIGLAGGQANIGLFGIGTRVPLSLAGIGLMLVYLLKAVTAYGLITQKDWAVKLALIDGIISLLLYLVKMFSGLLLTTYTSGASTFHSLSLEIVIVIPYIYKMWKIKDEWEANTYALQENISGQEKVQ